jgi:hypothetical protein
MRKAKNNLTGAQKKEFQIENLAQSIEREIVIFNLFSIKIHLFTAFYKILFTFFWKSIILKSL